MVYLKHNCKMNVIRRYVIMVLIVVLLDFEILQKDHNVEINYHTRKVYHLTRLNIHVVQKPLISKTIITVFKKLVIK